MPASMVFAAAFGEQNPVASNNDEQGRSQNRRVEMAPVPRNTDADSQLKKDSQLNKEQSVVK